MNRFVLTVIALLIPIGLLWWGMKPSTEKLQQPVRDKVAEFSQYIETELGLMDPVCLNGLGPFPSHPHTTALPLVCKNCNALIEAGILQRQSKTGVYELTTKGKPFYFDTMNVRNPNLATAKTPSAGRQPRLCFGESHVHAIVESLPMMKIGSDRVVSMKVVLEVRNPADILFTEQGRALELPLPKRDSDSAPWLLPPRVITFVLSPSGSISYMDNGIRYGKWINEK